LVALLAVGTGRAENIRGTITKVDLKNKEVTIEGRGHGLRGVALRFRLDKDSRILFGREVAVAKDLAAGYRVLVRYELRGDDRFITVIRVRGGKKAQSDGRVISGPIRQISLKNRQIVIAGWSLVRSGAEITLKLPEGLRVTRAGKEVPVDELTEGTWLRVRREQQDGKWIVQSVQVIEGGPEYFIKKARAGLRIAGFLLALSEQPDEEGDFTNGLRQSLKYADLFLNLAENAMRADGHTGKPPAPRRQEKPPDS
jgi:hypothetical protein